MSPPSALIVLAATTVSVVSMEKDYIKRSYPIPTAKGDDFELHNFSRMALVSSIPKTDYDNETSNTGTDELNDLELISLTNSSLNVHGEIDSQQTQTEKAYSKGT